MQIWAETGKSALPIHNYSQILYQFLTFTQNLKRSRLLEVLRKLQRNVRTMRMTFSIFVKAVSGHKMLFQRKKRVFLRFPSKYTTSFSKKIDTYKISKILIRNTK